MLLITIDGVKAWKKGRGDSIFALYIFRGAPKV
jgi:hypothetical protein